MPVTSKLYNKIVQGKHAFIIAEAGVNHNGSLKNALRLVDVAVKAKCDAVKFQTFITEEVISKKAPKAKYQTQTTGSADSQFEMVKKLELNRKDHDTIAAYCRTKGILFLSTPFDMKSADMLEDMGVPLFKIPSGEITNFPFLTHIARKKKPIILSTGMSTLAEVRAALEVIHRAGNKHIILLQCVTAYPALLDALNLRAMVTMRESFQIPVGFSDHSLGINAAIAATALGACVIEKHFTLDKAMPGPDHRASLEPIELVSMVQAIRDVGLALGDGIKKPALCEKENIPIARKSVVVVTDLPKGHRLTRADIAIKRPGTGIPPRDIHRVMGKVLKRGKKADDVLMLGDLS